MAELEQRIALKVDEKDNVSTIFSNDSTAGSGITVRDKKGGSQEITLLSSVPYGHKIAIRDIKKGEHIIKYGESIGAATADIPCGEYVHVHNMEALRGRGDL